MQWVYFVVRSRKTRLQIAQLVKDTSAELDHVRETDKFGEVDVSCS